jgi:hypothetical protein
MRVSEQLITLGGTSSASGGGGPANTETTAWINAVVAAGGTVSANQTNRVDALITGLKADGLWTGLDRLWLWGGESVAAQATIDIKTLAVGVAQAGLVLAAGGYTGNGSTRYFDSGYNPTTASGNFVRNSASIGAYIRSSNTTQANTERAFAAIGSASTVLIPLAGFGGGSATYGVNSTSTPVPVNTNRQGFWHANRSSSAAIQLYKNGSVFDSSADTSIAPDNLPFYFFASSAAGPVAQNFLPDQMAAAFIALSYDATQAGNLSTRLNTYMTAWGINVY